MALSGRDRPSRNTAAFDPQRTLATRPKVLKGAPAKKAATPEPTPEPVVPTEHELRHGWTTENLTEYLTEDGSIHSQQYQK